MADSRRVDLVVRAKDVEAKPLADLLKLIDQLGAGLSDLEKEGGPATRTLNELTTVVKDFGTVSKEIASRKALVENFLALEKGAAGAAERFNTAKVALETFKAGLEGVDKKTKEQTDTLRLLTREYNLSEKQVKSFANRQTTAVSALSAIGVAAADAASELQRLGEAEQRVDKLSLQAERNVRGRDAAVRALKEQRKAADELAAATAALAKREQEESDALARMESAGRAELLSRGQTALQAELQALKEAAALSGRLADQRIADAKRLEQAESDRLAIIQHVAEVEQKARGQRDLAAELRVLKEYAEAERIRAQDKAAADALELKRGADLLAMDKARAALRDRAAAENLRIVNAATLAERQARAAAASAAASAAARASSENLRIVNAANAARANEAATTRARKEQAESDRLALMEAAGRDELAARGAAALQAELLMLKEAADRDAQRLAFTKAISEQKEKAVAAQREETDQLQKAAVAARATLSEMDKLVAAVQQLRATPAAQSLARQIAEIAAPTKLAAFSLDELANSLPKIEQRQRQAANSMALNAEESKQLARDYKALQTALESLASVAGSVDSFRKQAADLERLDQALAEARQKLQFYAEQAKRGLGGQEVASGLAQQEKVVQQLSQEYQRLGARVADAQRMLDAMGIKVEHLDQVEKDLLATTQRTRNAFDAASDASTRLGQATEKATASMSRMHNESRTALSLYQRVRGQVLSMAAAYIGLFGVINEGQRTIDAAVSLQGINSRLGVAFGDDPKVIAQELGYVREQANRLGLDLKSAAEGYSRFVIAGKSANLTTNETRFIFEKFSEVSRVFRLSVDDTAGVFKALDQVLSKAKVQSEELRGQLGDRLSGALNQFAKGLGISTKQLDKLLESGKVPAEFLLLFAKQFGESVKSQVEPASKAFDASIARLSTALFDFRNQVAEGGLLESLGKLAERMANFLNSNEGAQAAKTLATAFTVAAGAAGFLFDVVRGGLSALSSMQEAASGLKAGLSGAFDSTGLSELTAGILRAVDATKALGYALGILGTAGGVVAVLTKVTAWVVALTGSASAATLAVRLLGITIKGLLWPVLLLLVGVDVFRWAERNFSWVAKTSIVLETLFQKLEAIGSFLSKPVPITGMSKALDELKKKLREIDDVQSAAFEKIVRKENGTQVLPGGASGRVTLPSTGAGGGRGSVAPTQQGTQLDSSTEAALRAQIADLLNQPNQEAVAKAKHDLAEAMALVKSVESATAALEVSAAKKSASEADDAARAIDLQYQGLIDNIHKLSTVSSAELAKIREEAKKSGFNVTQTGTVADLQKALLARVEAAKATLKQEAADKLAAKQAKEKVDALLSERDALVEVAKLQAQLDPSKAVQFKEAEIAIIEKYRAEIEAAANAAADLAEKEGKIADAAKLRAVALKAASRGSDTEVKRAQLGDKQTEIQKQTAERDAKLSLVDTQLSTDNIDAVQAQRDRVAIMEEYATKIGDAARAARELAAGLGDTTMVANMDALLLKLQQTDEQSVKLGETFKTSFGQALVDAAMAGAQALGEVIFKGGDINDVFDSMGKVFANFAVTFLNQVAAMIIQTYALAAAQAILRAVGGGMFGGGAAGAAGGAVNGSAGTATLGAVAHSGGIVGSITTQRAINSEVFAGAQRFHTGTKAPIGLNPGEVPAILQKGEEVLSRNSPRNILNGGAAAGGPGEGGSLKAVIVDDQRKAIEHLTSSHNERAFLMFAKKNTGTLKQLLKG